MASSSSLPPNLTAFSTFLERCSLPELTWFLDTVVDHFDGLLEQSHSTHSVPLKNYIGTKYGSTATVPARIQIPCIELDEESYGSKHIGIDLENRVLYFPPTPLFAPSTGAGDDIPTQTSPLSAISFFVADLLAATLWDKSVKPQKHSRVRLTNNTFVVLDGLYSRFSRRWLTRRDDGNDMLYAVSVMQILLLEKLRLGFQGEPSAIQIMNVPSEVGKILSRMGFVPIEALDAQKAVDSYPHSVVVSRGPLATSNNAKTNGVSSNHIHFNEARFNGLQSSEGHCNGVENNIVPSKPAHAPGAYASNTSGSPTVKHDPPALSNHPSVTLVVPSAGRSSRFPGVKPKWMLTQPSGALMVVDALRALDLTYVSHIVVGLLEEHVQKYCGGDVQAILSAFEDGVPGLREIKISIVVIEKETVDQVQTIECILAAANVQGPIFLKDCDNQFACAVPALDGVATLAITRETESTVSNVASKGYVSVNPQTNQLTSIVEKSIISNTFCIGGYSFLSAADFLARVAHARHLQILGNATAAQGAELAVSDIIWLKMVDPSVTTPPFVSIPARNYEDWGTLPTWRAYCDSFKTLFVDIDGTLMKNSGQYFTPTWGTTQALPQNVAYLNELHATGRVCIILVTSRLERFREKTVAQLKEHGVKYDQLLMGMLHAKRVMINDYAPTNPFPAAAAVNLGRNQENLREMMGY